MLRLGSSGGRGASLLRIGKKSGFPRRARQRAAAPALPAAAAAFVDEDGRGGRRSYRASPSAASSSSSSSSSSSVRDRIPRVLVANRGEIACRVIRTCRRLGIETVALYSVDDGPSATHAQRADEAHPVGTGPSAADSYLRQGEVLEVAARCGAAAVHPGYGFLSERAGFCRAVGEAGLIWIGPPPGAIAAMGSKSESKAIMEGAGVPTTPGYHGDDQQEVDFLRSRAVEVGFPVLIKAVAGGGGKGMRLVWKEADFEQALQSCQRESLAAFGDDRVLLEKYLVRPRHVEVQIVADQHGNVLHLHERDCSLQRRHQKIIEEAPASDLDLSLRQKLGEMAKRAAAAVGYVSAGTVEFLLDCTAAAETGEEEPPFYFCEMNTRLQVEHPVTEFITGVDLVEWQLRIAAGERLPLSQSDVAAAGHAFEARIYAENPARNFFPATGRVWHHRPPVGDQSKTGFGTDSLANEATGIRVDTGLLTGQDVSVYYDPMISKLIVHDENREKALDLLIRALKKYQIAGLPTNIDFLIKCAQHPTFQQAGAVNTGFLDEHADDVRIEERKDVPSPMAQVAGAFAVLLTLEGRVGPVVSKPVQPWSSQSGSWRMGGEAGRPLRKLRLEHGKFITCVSNRDGSFDVRVASPGEEEQEQEDASIFHVNGSMESDGGMEIVVNRTKRIKLTAALRNTDDGMIQVRMWPENLKDDYHWELDVENPMVSAHGDASALSSARRKSGEHAVPSPMPGKISRVHYAVGDQVEEGDVVVVLEAMKMEHACKSPCSGTVTELPYSPDDVVNDGAILFIVTSPETDEPTADGDE